MGLPAQAQAPQGTQARATVRITCIHPGAMIYVDHQMVGTPPLDVIVAPGTHEVRVSVDDRYLPFVEMVTVAPGEVHALEVALQMTAPALYEAGMRAFSLGEVAQAEALLTQASRSPGKKAAEIPFYLGLLAERRGDLQEAERDLVAYLGVKDSSPVAHYRLGTIRQARGQAALAATAYKSALGRLVTGIPGVLANAGPLTSANIARLQRMASAGSASGVVARIQLAWVYERKGAMTEARDLYRQAFSEVVERERVDTTVPFPAGVPFTLPAPGPLHRPADGRP